MTTNASPRREEILKALRESRRLLDTFGVSRLSLFGSFARAEGRVELVTPAALKPQLLSRILGEAVVAA